MDLKTAQRLAQLEWEARQVNHKHVPPPNEAVAEMSVEDRFRKLGSQVMSADQHPVVDRDPTGEITGYTYTQYARLPGNLQLNLIVETVYEAADEYEDLSSIKIELRLNDPHHTTIATEEVAFYGDLPQSDRDAQMLARIEESFATAEPYLAARGRS